MGDPILEGPLRPAFRRPPLGALGTIELLAGHLARPVRPLDRELGLLEPARRLRPDSGGVAMAPLVAIALGPQLAPQPLVQR
jgi:hypothetical protein